MENGREIARFKNESMGIFSVAFDGNSRLHFGRTPYSRIAEQFAAGGQWSYRPGQRVPVKFRRGSYTQQATIALSDVGDIVEPLLNIQVSPDGKDWIAWTQPGYYTSSARGDHSIGWQVNQGRIHAAKFYYADQFREKFYRPDVVELALKTADVKQAVELANAEFANPPAPLDIRTDIQSLRPPTVRILEPVSGARLTSSKVVVRANLDRRVRQLSAGSQIPVMQRPHASTDDKIFRSLPAVRGRS